MANVDKLKAVKTPLDEIVKDVSDLKDYVATIGDKTFEHDTMLNALYDKLGHYRLFINNLKYETDIRIIELEKRISELEIKNKKNNIIILIDSILWLLLYLLYFLR